MRVSGVAIPGEAIARGIAAMGAKFTAVTVSDAMRNPIADHMRTLPGSNDRAVDEVVLRAADRLIQQQRKAGVICFGQVSRTWSAR